MPKADLILKNAKVITMDTAKPLAEMVAIKGDRILLVGSNNDAESVRGAQTKVIDCRGKTVVPGFNDAHCHVFSFIRKLLSIDVSPATVRSIEDIKRVIREHAQRTPPGTWLSGTGYNEFYLAEKRHPNRWDLDEAAPNHPVVLAHRSLHACVLNSMALRLAGITIETEVPPGALIDRDLNTGEPTGLLFEMLGYIRKKVMPPLSQEELDEGVSLANQQYLSLGITSLQEATITNDMAQWEVFRSLKIQGKLQSRLSMMFGVEAVNEFREAGLVTGSGDSQLRVGGIKVQLNEATGQLQPTQSELNELAVKAQREGFQLAMHAVEESTVEAAIKALEDAHNQFPEARPRHRIEHCSECPPHLIERLNRLGTVVVTQPPFIYSSGERYLATVEKRKLPYLYPLKAFSKAGLVAAGSSDSPVSPNNPLIGIYAAVTRRAESGQTLTLEQGISVSQALAMYSINAAYASLEETVKGSLSPGKLADMVVLSADPTQVPSEEIKDMRVEMTILGGRVVWE